MSIIVDIVIAGVRTVFHPLLIIWVPYAIYNIFFHPLRFVPGPLSVRLGFPIWQFLHTWRQDYAFSLKELHDKYGDCVRIGLKKVSTTHPDAVHAIYAYNGAFTKTHFYTGFWQGTPNLFAHIDPEQHASQRRAVLPIYSMKSLMMLEEYMEPCINYLLKSFNDTIQTCRSSFTDKPASSTQNASIDLSKWLQFFAVDVIGELAFGHDFDLLKSGKDKHFFLDATRTMVSLASLAGVTPFPWSKENILSLLGFTAQHTPQAIIERSAALIRERHAQVTTNGGPPRMDILAQLMDLKHPTTGAPLDQLDILFHGAGLLIAGGDTTAITLCAFFYYIIRNPHAHARVQEEIDTAFDEGRLQNPVTHAQAVKLDYFQGCVKETLRLLPPVGMDLPRYVPEGGLLVGPHHLPKGTSVGASAYTFHRSKCAFGEDADEFRPERWVEASETQRALMERHNIAFGAGNRVCIGRNISLMEINKVLPTLLRRYSFAFTSRAASVGSDEPWTIASTFFFAIHDFYCDITLRRPDELDI